MTYTHLKVSMIAVYFSGFVAAAVWVGGGFYVLREISGWDMKIRRPMDYKITISTYLEDIAAHGLKLFLQDCAVFAICTVSFVVSSQTLKEPTVVGVLRRMRGGSRRILRFLIWGVGLVVPSVEERFSESSTMCNGVIAFLKLGKSISVLRTIYKTLNVFIPSVLIHTGCRITYHSVVHIMGIVATGSFAMLLLGSTVFISDALKSSTGTDFISLTAPVIFPAFIGIAAIGLFGVTSRIAHSMISPFLYSYLDSRPFNEGDLFPYM